MENFTLTEESFAIYCAKYYDGDRLSWADFLADLQHIKYIKRLLNRYVNGGELKERLILNHMIILFNVFEAPAATTILFYRLDDSLHPHLKTFLTYLNRMPEFVLGARPQIIHDDQIPFVEPIRDRLNAI